MPYRRRLAAVLTAAVVVLSLSAEGLGDVLECDGTVIDVGPMGTKTVHQSPGDIYVALRERMEIAPDSVFKVFRPGRVSDSAARRYPVSLYLGRLQIIDVQGEVLIGRMIEFASAEEHPRVRYDAVMIGDCVKLEPSISPVEITREELQAETLEIPAMTIPGAAEMPGMAETPGARRVIPMKIRFKFDSSRIEDEWKDELRQIAGFIAAQRPARVVVEGHACWIGTDEYNMGLSRRRAQAVVDYLVDHHGLDRGLFMVEPYGESRPEESNLTVQGRRHNRRAVVSVLLQVIPTVEALPEVPAEWPLAVAPEKIEPEVTEIPVIPPEPSPTGPPVQQP